MIRITATSGFILLTLTLGCGDCGGLRRPQIAGTFDCSDRSAPTLQFEMPTDNAAAYNAEQAKRFDFSPSPPHEVTRDKSSLFVRDPTVGNQEGNTLWARAGDPVVLDIIWRVDGENPEGSTLPVDVFAFVDMKIVPVSLAHGTYEQGKATFATIDDLAKASTQTASQSEARHGETMVFSVLFPPEVLGEAGAKDIRLAMALRPNPSAEAIMMKSSSRVYDFTLYYGGMEFDSKRPVLVASDYREPDSHRAYLMDFAAGGLLEPPAESLDVIDGLLSARLGEVLDVPDDPIRVRAWMTGSGHYSEEGTEMGGEVGLVTLVGTEVLPEASGLAINRPREYYNRFRSDERQNFSKFATVLDIELPPDEGTQVVRMIKFSAPFCHQRDPEAESSWSNILFVR